MSRPTVAAVPRSLLMIAVLVVVGIGAGMYSLLGGGAKPAGGPPGGAPPVTVAQPQVRPVTEWIEFTGVFTPADVVEVRARVSGYLTEIHFTDGQTVEKGDLLFVIDPRPFEIALASARAKLDSAQGSVVFAQRQLQRAGELQKRDFLAQSTLDQRTQEQRSSSAGVDGARAAVREAELNLQFTRVLAPMSGRISLHQVSIGNLVNAGGSSGTGTLLTTIVATDPMKFTFDMSEADLLALQRRSGAKLEPGNALDVPVRLRLMDEQGWPHTGHLDFLDNQIDRGSGTIRARAVIDKSERPIPPGAFGRIQMAASAAADAMLLPDAAIVTDQSRKLVMTVTPDGTVAPRPVELGPVVDGLRVIRSGIAPTDQVIVNGLMRARPGAKVTPQPAAAAPAAQPAPAGK
ncbi:MAG: efflux RND transporter periplasmic adaptor subunit [Actinomycetota bacterium]